MEYMMYRVRIRRELKVMEISNSTSVMPLFIKKSRIFTRE